MIPAATDALASAALALARRFHLGATLWCWSPSCPSHAEHLAVEFVHPVIVGKRARPAIALSGDDAAGRLRGSARADDVLVVIGSGDDAGLADVVTRAPAWGLATIWLAHRARPALDTGGLVVWLGDDAMQADIVCAYHLLWELTHVCFEQPGVLEWTEETPTCPACMDAGDIGEVDEVDAGGIGSDSTVVVAGVRRRIDLSLVGPCDPGELVVVHAGVAITKLAVPKPTRAPHG